MEDQTVLKAFNEAINATLKNMGFYPSEPRSSDLMMTKEGHETSVLLDDSQMNLIS